MQNPQGSQAKRIRGLSNHLRLDNRTSGYECRNNIRGHIKKLAELKHASSDSVCVDMFANQVYDYAAETQKEQKTNLGQMLLLSDK